MSGGAAISIDVAKTQASVASRRARFGLGGGFQAGELGGRRHRGLLHGCRPSVRTTNRLPRALVALGDRPAAAQDAQ